MHPKQTGEKKRNPPTNFDRREHNFEPTIAFSRFNNNKKSYTSTRTHTNACREDIANRQSNVFNPI